MSTFSLIIHADAMTRCNGKLRASLLSNERLLFLKRVSYVPEHNKFLFEFLTDMYGVSQKNVYAFCGLWSKRYVTDIQN